MIYETGAYIVTNYNHYTYNTSPGLGIGCATLIHAGRLHSRPKSMRLTMVWREHLRRWQAPLRMWGIPFRNPSPRLCAASRPEELCDTFLPTPPSRANQKLTETCRGKRTWSVLHILRRAEGTLSYPSSFLASLVWSGEEPPKPWWPTRSTPSKPLHELVASFDHVYPGSLDPKRRW